MLMLCRVDEKVMPAVKGRNNTNLTMHPIKTLSSRYSSRKYKLKIPINKHSYIDSSFK